MGSVDLAVFLATSGHSGVDRVFRNLLPAIAALGYRVDLLGIAGHGPRIDHVVPGMRHIVFGVSHVMSALPALMSYLRITRPTILLTDKDRVNRAALAGKWLSHVPTRLAFRQGTAVSVNVLSRGTLDRWVQTLSMRYLYRYADHLLVPSRGAAEDLAAFTRLPCDRISVVPSPIVSPDLAVKAAMAPPHQWFNEQVPVLLGVGELSGRKDFATLVRAFARVREHRHCRLVILGEGRHRRSLLDLASALGVANDFALPGFVDNPYPAMARAAAFALTSRWEGMPVALIEAVALGVPVAACNCPSGPRELLADGRHGPLVPVGDDVALAAALESLLDHPPHKAHLQEAARPYTVEASARAYLAALGLDARS